MIIISVFLGIILLLGRSFALPNNNDTIAESTTEAPRSLSSLTDIGSVVQAEGWGIFLPANSILPSGTINLGTAANGKACLTKCATRETPGCRLVSFDLNKRVCTGWTEDMEGVFLPNSSSILLALSSRRSHRRPGVYVPAQDDGLPYLRGRDGRHVANGNLVYGESACLSLCLLHPKCLSL
ncbi:hypothetical protein BV898_10027 [Hypsibius exemplaris]|uniref:Apple domain-containing protein n=1 Tax=Hypsibius exemplaris TaxID=2072580 RepID=A0A1W0WKX3_HYPEX|nr:hypothetical protein BV898_10027 [Hypsibius exemplaris]